MISFERQISKYVVWCVIVVYVCLCICVLNLDPLIDLIWG